MGHFRMELEPELRGHNCASYIVVIWEGDSGHGEVDWEWVATEAKRALEQEMPQELRDLFEMEVVIRVRRSETGSVYLLVQAYWPYVLSVYVFISQLTKFIEGVKLIGEFIKWTLTKTLKRYPQLVITVKKAHTWSPWPRVAGLAMKRLVILLMVQIAVINILIAILVYYLARRY